MKPDLPTQTDISDPPVSVIIVPESNGSRGYGAKYDHGTKSILIPYNPSVAEKFSDIKPTTVAMVRKVFFGLPAWKGE